MSPSCVTKGLFGRDMAGRGPNPLSIAAGLNPNRYNTLHLGLNSVPMRDISFYFIFHWRIENQLAKQNGEKTALVKSQRVCFWLAHGSSNSWPNLCLSSSSTCPINHCELFARSSAQFSSTVGGLHYLYTTIQEPTPSCLYTIQLLKVLPLFMVEEERT